MNILPITLVGDNLGKRHQYLNKLVENAFQSNIPFKSIEDAEEESTIDKLFKIDLASKYKHVDYIIKCLKDADMLFVSRALKSAWLIQESQFSDVINPSYLEESLYPGMSTTAVNKTRSRISLLLNDEERCQTFHEYYKKSNFKYACKFLPKCNEGYILKEMVAVPEKITPHYLKLLCEKTPKAGELYFKTIITTKKGQSSYLDSCNEYLEESKLLLKSNPDIYFYAIENFYTNRSKLSAESTKHIMERHKDKFFAKPELYAVKFLNIDVLAKYLSTDEIKDLIVKLARAAYFKSWFNYKKVEPLLKRMDKNEKKAFVRKIFVDKDVGEMVEKPPYALPSQPTRIDEGEFSNHSSSVGEELEDCGECAGVEMALMSCDAMYQKCAMRSAPHCIIKRRTLLDELFDTYRFSSFPKTFYELKKRLLTESSHNNRMMIMNVLVSKSAGKEEQVFQLLEFLSQRHSNEPSNVRASVIRSLVKRACVFRLSDQCWNLLVDFARGIETEDCSQYVHASVIRLAMAQQPPPDSLVKDFLQEFDSLSEYELTVAERTTVQRYILDFLLTMAQKRLEEKDADGAKDVLWKIFTTLEELKVKVEDRADILALVTSLSDLNNEEAESIFSHLYDLKTCRKIFFKQNFAFKPNDESYVNALKHDADFLNDTGKFKELMSKGDLNHEHFLQKLSIYFAKDLAKQYLAVLEDRTKSELNFKESLRLGRSICLLKGAETLAMIQQAKSGGVSDQKLAKVFCQNLHLARPQVDRNIIKWKEIGAIAANNLLINISPNAMEQYIPKLMAENGRSYLRLALALSYRALGPDKLTDILASAYKRDHHVVLRSVLRYLSSQLKLHPGIWGQIKTFILEADLKKDVRLVNILMNTRSIPTSVKREYCMAVYTAVKGTGIGPDRNNFKFGYLQNILRCLCDDMTKLDPDFVNDILKQFLETNVTGEQRLRINRRYRECEKIYVIMLSKSLMVCTDESVQNKRFENFVQPFLRTLCRLWPQLTESRYQNAYIKENLDIFLRNLKSTSTFMNSTFVSPLPIYERVLSTLKEYMSVEEHFEMYSHIHLTMLFYKCMKQCVKQWPEIVNDNNMMNETNIERVGAIFGRYLAHELLQLQAQYFPSVLFLYKDNVLSYVRQYFGYGAPIKKFNDSLLRGLLDDKTNSTAILFAVLLFKDLHFDEDDIKKEFNFVKELDSAEIKFYFDTNIY